MTLSAFLLTIVYGTISSIITVYIVRFIVEPHMAKAT